jgi:hypothetical protein
VLSPDGTESLTVLHRQMWDLDETRPGQGRRPPAGIPDTRESIWISFVPLAAVKGDFGALILWTQHRFLAGGPEFAFEELKTAGDRPSGLRSGLLDGHRNRRRRALPLLRMADSRIGVARIDGPF